MNIGFTGTREGMTYPQKQMVSSILSYYAAHENGKEFHHGNCVGSDVEAAIIADSKSYITVAHPAKGLIEYQATNYKSDKTMPPDEPLKRNKAIVKASELMIACPKELREPPPLRGQGTWSCVRHARAVNKKVIIIWPDGSVNG